LKLDSSQFGDFAGYIANIHEPGARSDAELNHGYGLQALGLGELCRLEEAERVLLPHDQIEGDFGFVAAEERDKDGKDVQVQRFRKPFVKNSTQPFRYLVQQKFCFHESPFE
jgi:hypothetical protein